MPRPCKAAHAKVHRREVLATDAGWAVIKARAAREGTSISVHLVDASARRQHVVRADWQERVRLLAAVDRRLGALASEALATDASGRAAPLDVVAVTAALLALERAVRAAATTGSLDEEGWDAGVEQLDKDSAASMATDHEGDGTGGDGDCAGPEAEPPP